MSPADFHAMAKARTALLEAKNELIRCGCGSELTLLMLRDAESALTRQINAHLAACPSTSTSTTS